MILPNGRQIMVRTWEQYRGETDPATGCREWQGVRSNVGYGFIGWSTPGRRSREPGYYGQMTVHRVALMLKLGRDIAPGMNANHTCHNKLCTEDSHLVEGTQRQKMKEMMRDGITMFGQQQRPYDHRQAGRKYRYSDEEIAWTRDATIQQVAQRFGLTAERAAGFRKGMRVGYRWLPWPGRDLVVPGRPGRRPKPLTDKK